MTRGGWHHVELFVKANTPGSSDGAQRFWIDGHLPGKWTGLVQRTSRIVMLNALQLTFAAVGGAQQTQHVYLDDVEVRTAAPYSSPAPPSTAPVPVASVTVTLASGSLTIGQSTQATAILRDAQGNVLTGRLVSWSASAASVATVSGSGLVSAVGAGTTQVIATTEGQSGSAPLTVTSPPPSGVPLLFASDFSTALGNSTTAVSDANRTPHWNDIHPDADQLYVVSAAGLGFPSGITNVLRVRYMGINSADVKTLSQWPEPATGGSQYYRLYYRFDVPNSYGNLAFNGHHPIEPVPGTCPYQWEFRVSSSANGTMGWYVSFLNGAGDFHMTLHKFQTYRFEWALKNRTSLGTYKFEIRVYDASDRQVGSSGTFVNAAGVSLATVNPDVVVAASCATSLTVGSNGPSGWESVGTSTADAFSYFSGVAVSQASWIGPYVAGEHP